MHMSCTCTCACTCARARTCAPLEFEMRQREIKGTTGRQVGAGRLWATPRPEYTVEVSLCAVWVGIARTASVAERVTVAELMRELQINGGL